ncbi:Thioredoxin [Musa troglodytarum]|uniref:Thioredoxin n=1 Tax=Musa troglodytarum TaxID=320322 RepID=A0A9E7GFQ8_9LILI|nr:Thioredoxin [Musa troglodytarum]
MGGLFSSQSTAEEGESAVIAVHSAGEWAKNWQSHTQSNKLMIIDFAASWCGPCRSIEPAIKAMSARFTNAVFLKVDVDELPVSKQWKVQAVPTFVLVKRGQEVGRIVGAKKDELQRTIQLHLNM